MRLRSLALLAPLLLLMLPAAARAETVSLAVAANFTDVAKAIGAAFKAKTGNEVTISAGATGGLYTQISQGAPFEVFLSADSKTPAKAAAAGFGVKGTQFTYAVGKLVLFSASSGVEASEAALTADKFDKLSIANPETAPYGAAAVATLRKLGLYDKLQPKLVTGESIAQAYQFVDSGNAQLGFVALSQVVKRPNGSKWLVPQDDYAPITQDAILLTPGKDSAAAKDFLDFLKGAEATGIIKSYGYDIVSK